MLHATFYYKYFSKICDIFHINNNHFNISTKATKKICIMPPKNLNKKSFQKSKILKAYQKYFNFSLYNCIQIKRSKQYFRANYKESGKTSIVRD